MRLIFHREKALKKSIILLSSKEKKYNVTKGDNKKLIAPTLNGQMHLTLYNLFISRNTSSTGNSFDRVHSYVFQTHPVHICAVIR